MTAETFVTLVRQLGVPVAMLFLYVYIDIQRRRRDENERGGMVERLQNLEDYQRKELASIVQDNAMAFGRLADASNNLAEASKENSKTLSGLTIALRSKRCVGSMVDQIDSKAG